MGLFSGRRSTARPSADGGSKSARASTHILNGNAATAQRNSNAGPSSKVGNAWSRTNGHRNANR